ncbi:MAG: site-specific integrase [Lactobacillus sp.]|nr:site-specific integrase [Lactobacillus sp.]
MNASASNIDGLLHRFVVFIDATPNTARTYKTSLRQWFKYMYEQGIRNPDPDDVRNYRTYLKKAGKKPTTVQNYIIAVKQFFKWTEAEGLYPNVAKYVKGAKLSKSFKKDYLTSRQARKVLEDIDRSNLLGKRNYAMLILMLTMGLRTIEVSRANVEDIRNSGNSTVLYVQGKGHTEKDAMVRMPSVVEDAIRDYLKARKSSSLTEPLFTSTSNNNKGKRLTTRTIRGTVKRCFIKAGFDSPKLTAHSTRHTTATLSLLNGATLQQTQALLRHKNMQTTEIYAHNIQASKNPASNDVANAIFN